MVLTPCLLMTDWCVWGCLCTYKHQDGRKMDLSIRKMLEIKCWCERYGRNKWVDRRMTVTENVGGFNGKAYKGE